MVGGMWEEATAAAVMARWASEPKFNSKVNIVSLWKPQHLQINKMASGWKGFITRWTKSKERKLFYSLYINLFIAFIHL